MDVIFWIKEIIQTAQCEVSKEEMALLNENNISGLQHAFTKHASRLKKGSIVSILLFLSHGVTCYKDKPGPVV